MDLMVKIKPERLLADLHELRKFGACGKGVVRTAFSQVDLDSRQWLIGKMTEVGLHVQVDVIGNVIGYSRNSGQALLMGSHTDTQPEGGWLDGSLGVIYALEVARTLLELPNTQYLAVDIASWMDEEGTFCGLLGSRSFCGKISPKVIANAKDRSGLTLTEVIHAAGLNEVPVARIDPGRYVAYLEAHIEQGARLVSAKKRIGVVTAIVGIRSFKLVFTGEQNHAGTTPMQLRKDAGMALIRLANDIDATYGKISGDTTVWTIGHVKFEPGSHSIVPGHAEMMLQFRDPDSQLLDRFEAVLYDLVATGKKTGPVEITIEPLGAPIPPAFMDDGLQEHIVRAAETHAPGDWIRMPSGAGHDAMVFADILPTAMLFVPSIGGISHSFAEDTKEEDIVLGCQVFATAAASILKAHI